MALARGVRRRRGMGALLPIRHGPKSPSKLTEAKVAEIQAQRDAGETIAKTATTAGVSTFSVRRATGSTRAVTQPALRADATINTSLRAHIYRNRCRGASGLGRR